MRIGAIFPQLEIGTDPAMLKGYAQAVEGMGYTHILAYDHVLGAGTATRPDWRGPYSSASLFHEPFVLFGYLAGLTTQLEFVTGVIILPQRQTTLVAKQAAEVDVLSGGRFRLGVGVGWNQVEYEALGENFHDRGVRSAEQIRLLRRLFTEEIVDFRGRWHRVDNAGINPLPVQRPIPIWLGGSSEATLKRIARLGDGWFPQRPPDDVARGMLEQLHRYAQDAGRDQGQIGIEARLSISQVPQDQWAGYVAAWRDLGATHLGINTMGAGLPSPQAHIDALRRVKDTLGF
jgi:probable F420-dependent oxidoreductase